ncbi:putative X8 domain-containing protein [Medicago truncatula]|uniref:Carbohydrate-binding X8 domain protein n=1 Tax=Medicago truncatula TaxID=3880 RepID=I3SNP7_MEDTR|nr:PLASMODESMATA CALLOSE-BINDING PROTEIN 3 [Medicago truncatula]AFK41889.1 unknown [Medicago truncatula]KEH32015.1 carbohydrate-binding X8 domain protein [Medicago truncatula]RHN63722.1 putative X8 domain-containing protein [Medicago truncatula]
MAFATLALALLLFPFTAIPSSANWCVCKDGADAILQKTLDYACGAGADCNPLHTNAPCYNPNTVRAHCSYAVNSYYQKKGQQALACDFAGTATVVTSDPSVSGCAYPSSASGSGTSTTSPSTGTGTGTGMGTTPSTSTGTGTGTSTGTGMGTGTSTGATGNTPYSTTAPGGVLGGIGSGMGPSGAGGMNDDSHGGLRLVDTSFLSIPLFSVFIMFWWG